MEPIRALRAMRFALHEFQEATPEVRCAKAHALQAALVRAQSLGVKPAELDEGFTHLISMTLRVIVSTITCELRFDAFVDQPLGLLRKQVAELLQKPMVTIVLTNSCGRLIHDREPLHMSGITPDDNRVVASFITADPVQTPLQLLQRDCPRGVCHIPDWQQPIDGEGVARSCTLASLYLLEEAAVLPSSEVDLLRERLANGLLTDQEVRLELAIYAQEDAALAIKLRDLEESARDSNCRRAETLRPFATATEQRLREADRLARELRSWESHNGKAFCRRR